jgi:hypothetical protein
MSSDNDFVIPPPPGRPPWHLESIWTCWARRAILGGVLLYLVGLSLLGIAEHAQQRPGAWRDDEPIPAGGAKTGGSLLTQGLSHRPEVPTGGTVAADAVKDAPQPGIPKLPAAPPEPAHDATGRFFILHSFDRGVLAFRDLYYPAWREEGGIPLAATVLHWHQMNFALSENPERLVRPRQETIQELLACGAMFTLPPGTPIVVDRLPPDADATVPYVHISVDLGPHDRRNGWVRAEYCYITSCPHNDKNPAHDKLLYPDTRP